MEIGGSMSIRHDGEGCVVLIVNGKLVGKMPPHAADAMAKGLIAKAREAEAYLERDRIAYEGAVLLRSGRLPFGLATEKCVAREAWSLSQHDRDLRRYIPAPSTVPSKADVYAPAVRQSPPRPKPKED